MKKFSKILTIFVAALLLVSVMTVAISAITYTGPSVVKYTGVGETADYEVYYSATDKKRIENDGVYDFPAFSLGNMNGLVKEQLDEATGNVYLEWQFSEEHFVNSSSSYYNSITAYPKALSTKYAIYEFDIASAQESEWLSASIGFAIQNRTKITRYNSTGASLGTTTSYVNGTPLTIYKAGTTSISGVSLPTGGEWSRVTIIHEFDVSDETYTVPVQAYTDTSTKDGTNTVNVECYELTVKHHVFINGKYEYTQSVNPGYKVDGKYYVPKVDYDSDNVYVDGIRMTWSPTSGAVRFDNLRTSYIPRDSGITTLDSIVKNLNETTNIFGVRAGDITIGEVSGNDLDAKNYFGYVDDVLYNDEASLVAAIKDGSNVELNADIEGLIDITGKNITITLADGIKAPKFISQDKTFTQEGNVITTADADAEDIKAFTFQYGKTGESIVMNSVVGTYLSIPDIYNPDSDAFAPEASTKEDEYNFTTHYTTLIDWTVAADGVTPDRLVTAETTAVTAISDEVEAVRVEVDADADGIIDLAGGYDWVYPFNPTINNEENKITREYLNENLNLEWFGVEIKYEEHDWYILKTGYNQADIDAIDYTKGGTYVIRSGQYELVPYVAMWANITVYTYFQMNYYLPAYSMEAAGVTDVVVTSGGANLDPFNNDTVTVGGKDYQRWVKNVGAGETADHEITVNYTVNGQKMVYTVNFGLPSYANLVMTDNVNFGPTSKTLIMNMVNYASQINTVLGNEVPALYTELMATYGDEYLALYNGLTNDKFIEGGDIYNEKVAHIDNTAAATYYTGLSLIMDSFEPMFAVKYAEAAATTNYTLAAPANSYGALGWAPANKTTSYFTISRTGNSIPAVAFAFEKGTNNKLAYNSSAWSSLDFDTYDYYVYPITGNLSYYSYDDKGHTGWVPGNTRINDYADDIIITVYENTKATDVKYTFNAAYYINGLITLQAAEEAAKLENPTVTDADIALAKCIYAYAQAAKAFLSIA